MTGPDAAEGGAATPHGHGTAAASPVTAARAAADRARWPWPVAVALALVGVAVNVVRPTAPTLGPVTTELATFDPALLATIEAYRAPRIALVPVLLLAPLAVAWWLARPRSRLGRRLTGAAEPGAPLPDVRRAVRTAVVTVALAGLAVLPARAWIGLVHERRWGFRTSSAGRWWADVALVTAGRWAVVALVVAAVVLAARRWPRTWPARATIAAAVVGFGGVVLHPVLLQPLLLSTEPLPDGPLRDAAAPVLDAAGVDVPLVLGDASSRTTRFNAVVVGLGPSERVVLFDTLRDLPPEQVASLVAHELAHQQHRDLLRGTALVPTATLVLAGAAAAWARRRRPDGAADPRLVPVLLAAALTVELLTGPVVAGLSRRVEAAADHTAFALGADPATVVALQRSAVVRDLASPHPAPWLRWAFATHPSPEERIRAAVVAGGGDDALPDLDTYRAEERERWHPAVPADEAHADPDGG